MYIYTLRRIQEFVCVGSHQLNRYKCVNVPYYIYQCIPYGIKRYAIIFVVVSILVRWFVRSFVILGSRVFVHSLAYCNSGGITPLSGRSNTNTTSSVRSMVLDTKACMTCSHCLTLITLNILHCHFNPPAKLANVVPKPSPRGNPMVQWEVYRKTSPTCSPPGPAAVTTAKFLRGSIFKPNGTL